LAGFWAPKFVKLKALKIPRTGVDLHSGLMPSNVPRSGNSTNFMKLKLLAIVSQNKNRVQNMAFEVERTYQIPICSSPWA